MSLANSGLPPGRTWAWGGPCTPRQLGSSWPRPRAFAPALCPRASCLGALYQLLVAGPAVTLTSHAVNSTQGAGAVTDAEKQRARPFQGHSVRVPHGRPTCGSNSPEFSPLLQRGGEPRTPRVTSAAQDWTKCRQEWPSRTPSSRRCFLTPNMCQTLPGPP